MHTRKLSLFCALAMSTACNDMGYMSAEMGVTQGGVQDINYARELIENGQIPDQSQFRSEGLFSEHDLPLTGEACELTLCPRTAVARVAPSDGSGDALMVQIGFGSNIDPDTYERRPQNLAVAVDISGSMTGMKMRATKDALLSMVDQLDERDTLSIIAFDDKVDIVSRPQVMNDWGRSRLKSKIERLNSDGGTNIEAGLEKAFEQAAKNMGQSGVEDRVMLFTDAQPNVGATGLSSFMGMTRHYAADGIGLSVFGVGLDLGAELATEISTVRGGNSFFLADQEEIEEVFEEDFAFIVSPIAYDLSVEISMADGWFIEAGYGIAMDSPGTELAFGASSLFLSRKNGGMAALLRHESGEITDEMVDVFGDIEVTFERADGSGAVTKSTDLFFEGGDAYELDIDQREVYSADQLGVFRMAVLVDQYEGLLAAADFCDGLVDIQEARIMVNRSIERLTLAASLTDDENLMNEADLMSKLRENLEQPQCNQAHDYYY